MEMRPYFVLLLPPYFSKLKCRRLNIETPASRQNPVQFLSGGAGLKDFGSGVPVVSLFFSTISLLRGATAAKSSPFSCAGTLNLSSVFDRSSARAANSPFVTL